MRRPDDRNRRHATATLLALLAWLAPAVVAADEPPAGGEAAAAAPAVVPVPLPELLRRAVSASPPVLASDARIQAARAVPDRVSAFPVPSVGVAALGFPGGPDGGWEIRYTARQVLPLGDRLSRRADAAWAAVGEAEADLETLELDLVLGIRLAWVELARARADAEVIDDQYGTIRRMSRIANNAYASGLGRGTQADTLRARAELPLLEDERRTADATALAARAELAALAALVEPEAPADPPAIDDDEYAPPELPSVEELLERALERRPELAALEARAAEAEALGLAAAEERMPDLMLEGGVQQRIGGEMPPVAFLVGVAITLPWLSPDAYEAMEAEARATGRMVRSDGDGLRFAIESDLRRWIARYEQLADGLDLVRRTIRSLRQAERAAIAAYTAGTGDFGAILDVEARLLQARRALVDDVHELQAVRARLDRIVAWPVGEQIERAEGWP